MYEYVDLMLIGVSVLLGALALHRANRNQRDIEKIKNLVVVTARNPKLGRKLLNELVK